MKIGLIGFGYWGKIIYKSLLELNYDNIVICDKFSNSDLVKTNNYRDLLDEKVDYVFVATIASEHYDIVKFFIQNKVNVFCEKPLTLNYYKSCELYHLAYKNNVKLFVDWIFTFNKSIHYIKYLIEELKLTPINIMMNRLNKGPVRLDTDAKNDLSSHDLSIILYLFNSEKSKDFEITNFEYFDFKRNINSEQSDSSILILNYPKFNVQINSSWEYGHKERNCIFQFEEGFIYWDDSKQSIDLTIDINENLIYNCYNSNELTFNNPLKDSINNFIKNDSFNYEVQEKITLTINSLLENNRKK